MIVIVRVLYTRDGKKRYGNIGKEVGIRIIRRRWDDRSSNPISVFHSSFGRLLFRIYIFINDLSPGEKCSVNNIPFLFPEKGKRGGGFAPVDRGIFRRILLTRFSSELAEFEFYYD